MGNSPLEGGQGGVSSPLEESALIKAEGDKGVSPLEELVLIEAEGDREVSPLEDGKSVVPQAAKKSSAGETPALPGIEEKDRMVRVTAAKIERLMGLG